MAAISEQKRLHFDSMLALGVAIVLIIFYVLFRRIELLVDEPYYFDYAMLVKDGIFTKPLFTTLPGYPIVVGAISWLTNATHIQGVRAIAFVMNVVTMGVVALCAFHLERTTYIRKTLLWILFPLIFPFLFLIYTDVFSTGVVLASFYLHMHKKYKLSGLLGGLAWFVRQNNIVWLFLLACYTFFESKPRDRIKNLWVHVLGMISFVVFVYINKGVAVGDVDAHPFKILSSGNVFFFLLLFFILFLPYNISRFPKIITLFKKTPALLLFLPSIFAIYMLTFEVSHPYNQLRGYFFRNEILAFITSNIYMKVAAFLPMLYAALAIMTTRFHHKKYQWIWVMSILYLLLSWQIEQRYYLIPISLFILLKKDSSPEVDYTGIAWAACLSGMLMVGIMTKLIFW